VSFAGKWKGKCTGQEKDQSFEISQKGCEAIGSDHEAYLIGSSKTESVFAKQGGYVGTATLDWNADETALNLYASGSVNLYGAHPGVAYSATGTLKIDGTRLLGDFTVAGQKVSCVYEKQ
jgi:hypothetical protein